MTVKKRISLAAAILGHKGGSSKSEKKVTAARKNMQKALSKLATFEQRSAAQRTVPEETRKANASKAGKLRWSKRSAPAMSKDEFARLTAGMTAKQIADAVGVSYYRVVGWRRKVNPVNISDEDAKKIREWAARKSGDKITPPDKMPD